MPVNIKTYDTRDELFEGLTKTVAAELADALRSKKRAALAVPGGTTPGPFLRGLSTEAIDWEKVSVMLTDERFVPESSDRSNTRLLRETLLTNLAAAARMIPFYKDAVQPEDVMADLQVDITSALPLDVCVLGMGEDMHTASLFPGADRLNEALAEGAPILLPMRAPGAPEPRLTLSADVLRSAAKIHLLITGQAKKDALEQALQPGPEAQAPVRAILNCGTPVTVHYAD